MRSPRNFVKRVSPAVRMILRVRITSAALFTVITLVIIVWFAFIQLALTVALYLGPVAGVLTALAGLSVLIATFKELTWHD